METLRKHSCKVKSKSNNMLMSLRQLDRQTSEIKHEVKSLWKMVFNVHEIEEDLCSIILPITYIITQYITFVYKVMK